MKKVFESKITGLKASKTRIYPTIRLPKEYSKIIGRKAEIYTTSHEGKLAFLVVVDYESLNKEINSDLEKRVSKLEKQIRELKDVIFSLIASKSQTKEKADPAGFEPAICSLGGCRLIHARLRVLRDNSSLHTYSSQFKSFPNGV